MTTTLAAQWMAAWPQALAAWSNYTQLRAPNFIEDRHEAAHEGMLDEIAAIRLQDQRINVNLETVRRRGLEDCALAILAHEIGHHIYVPGNLTDNARMIAAIARMLPGLPARVSHMVANLYGDLMINDRLQRRAGIDMAAVYKKLAAPKPQESDVWQIYMRTYEYLWSLPSGTFGPNTLTAEADADALLLSRLIRNFAGRWLPGARRFAVILYPYLAKDEAGKQPSVLSAMGMHDTKSAGAPMPGQSETDAIPDGLTDIDPSELEDQDDDFSGDILDPLGEHRPKTPPVARAPEGDGTGNPGHQYRQPFEYGQLLKALGLNLSEREIAIRYYRERALPHLIPFPMRRAPRAFEPMAEGYADWESGDPMEDLDVLGSMLRSPVMVPGVTTVQRTYTDIPGAEPGRIPLDLDIYVDSSGSMPNPGVDVSYLALAGTILALSALRAGARVQATLWSGPRQFQTSGGFIRDEKAVLGIITGYIGGSTAFPLHVLRDTYISRTPEKPTHIVVISDDGADTMKMRDERGAPGAAICERALQRAGGGGTLVLNLFRREWGPRKFMEDLGFAVHSVSRWEDLIVFARAFVRRLYGENQ